MTMRTVGKPTGRIEGPDKVGGGWRYAADIQLDGMLWGKVLRSPHAHAKIVSIDTAKAKSMPGVRAVLTGAEHPHYIGRWLRDLPVLAIDKVRFIGERVVAVAADSADQAQAAVDAIDVVYEELPAVFDADAAVQPGAPLVHDDPTAYVNAFVHPDRPDLPNICSYGRWTHGDIDAVLAGSDRVFEHTFRTQREHHGYMEPHACAVSVHADGTADVYASNKGPFLLRAQIATALEVEPASITVHPVPVGGDFGGKGSPMDAPVAYLLSRAAGHPVRMVMSYTEDMLAGNTRHSSTITVRAGVMNDGTLNGIQVDARFDSGAYGAFKPAPNINLHGVEQAASCYRLKALDARSTLMYTNAIPAGHMRSPGGPQVNFAVEGLLDIVAKELAIDPGEFRLRNLVRQGDTSPSGQAWGAIHATETLELAMERIGWNQPRQPFAGRGVAMYERGPIGGDSSCRIVVRPDGSLLLQTPVPDPGQGANTAMAQVLAETLELPLEAIAVESVTTGELPFDIGVSGSRTTYALGVTVMDAAEKLRDAVAETTGDALSAASLRAFAAARGADAAVTVHKQLALWPDPPATEFTAQAAEVEVDPETGQVTVTNLVSVHDAGTIINPAGHRGQIYGGAMFGFGMAVMQDYTIENGMPSAISLADYKIPNVADIPPMDVVYLSRDEGPGPFNAGSVAESANVPTPAAIANAVSDAIGIPADELPLSAERIHAWLGRKGG